MSALAPHASDIEILSWGYDVWRRRLLELDINTWASLGILRNAVIWLHRLRLHRLIAWLGGPFKWQTPLILVFRKNKDVHELQRTV